MTPLVGPSLVVPVRPPYLKVPSGEIVFADRLAPIESLAPAASMTSARQAGLRYEEKAKRHIKEVFPDAVAGLWWRWRTPTQEHRCQMDVVWFDPEHHRATVFEIKRMHTTEAWWQLRKLYQPVLKAWLGPRGKVNIVEVTSSFDCAVPMPEAVFDVKEVGLEGWCREFREGYGVYRWRPS